MEIYKYFFYCLPEIILATKHCIHPAQTGITVLEGNKYMHFTLMSVSMRITFLNTVSLYPQHEQFQLVFLILV